MSRSIGFPLFVRQLNTLSEESNALVEYKISSSLLFSNSSKSWLIKRVPLVSVKNLKILLLYGVIETKASARS